MWKRIVPIVLLGSLLACGGPKPDVLVEGNEYLESYFRMFPSQATAAGRHDLDDLLEDFSPASRADWVRTNEALARRMSSLLGGEGISAEDRLDAELLLREAERQVFAFRTVRRPERNPLFWTGIPANATVFLLVRDDLPEAQRLASAVSRARHIPRFAAQAREALSGTDPAEIAPELCRIAAGQARASATFYSDGFPEVGEDPSPGLKGALAAAGKGAGEALASLAEFLDALAEQATGSPRLGDSYAEAFHLATGVEEPIGSVLAAAQAALADKRVEAASYARSVWQEVLPEVEPPGDDGTLLDLAFSRVEEDRAETVDDFVAQYRGLVEDSIAFVRGRELMTLPDPLTLYTGRSPSFFIGQSVGGVYPAGPYQPEAETLWYLPTPSDSATPEQRDGFFRDFNDHFNVMITPHEIVPGHYLQLKFAARHPRKVRALFGDGVYIEGWGTFCERLMLDLGWGEPLDRLAHLKKQMENISRTIVDIRVHTDGMTRDDVLDFVQGEALQAEQFASNMWVRSITSAPQLTYYWLGYREVWSLFEDVQAARGDAFDLREFMDGMMADGPVPVRHYRERMIGTATR